MKKICFFVVSFLKNMVNYYSISTKVAWRIKNLEYRDQIRQDPSIAVLDKINYYKKPDWNSVRLLEMLMAMINELSEFLTNLHIGKQILMQTANYILNFTKALKYCVSEFFKSPKRSK
jgi:hypothetical protein